MQFPWVSRKKYDELMKWKQGALESLNRWDDVASFVTLSGSAKWGSVIQEEVLRLLKDGAFAAAKLAEITSPESLMQCQIDDLQKQIEAVELRAKLDRLRSTPLKALDEEHRSRPKIQDVLKIAAESRKNKTAK